MSLQTILNPFTNRLQYVGNPAGTVIPVAEGGTGTSVQFTTGSVIFAGAGGVYTQDNAKFFWDDTNDRLGIGTATPNYPLQIAGSIAGNLNVMSVINTRGQANDSVTLIFGVSSGLTNEAGSIRVTRTNSPNNGDSTIDIRNQKSGVLSSSLFADTAGLVGVGTTAPTHSLTLPSTATGIALYNTADQTTNYERLVAQRSANAALISFQGSGTASARTLRLNATSGSGGSNSNFNIKRGSAPFFEVTAGSHAATGNLFQLWNGDSNSHSSGTATYFAIVPTIAHTSTAGYTILDLNPTITSEGSGAKNFILCRKASGTTLFGVDSNGGLIANRVIVPSGTTTPVTITAGDTNKVYTNEGATAKIVYNLPTAVAGLTYTFIVQDTDGMDVTAAAGDTIRRNTNVTATGGTVTSSAIGSVLTLVAINATEWIATSEIGTWA